MVTSPAFTSADTLCAHAGQGRHDGAPLVPPIVQSTTFCRDSLESTSEHAYSRVSNPTVAALEEALGALEDAPPAVAFASGLAAESALFLALLTRGDHVLCSRAVYGGTTRLLEQLLGNLGIEVGFVDTTDPAAVAARLRPETRLVLVETPANPTLEVSDIAALSRCVRAHGALLAVDNTFLTAVLQRPLELGADITVCSTTKFVDGHSAALGGSVVTRDTQLLTRLRFVRKCTGAILSPFAAWLTLQGLKTLPLRLGRQSETAAELARWLDGHPAVARVHYPGLQSPDSLPAGQHRTAHGAVLSFEVRGGGAAVRALLVTLTLCRLVEHVGSVETLLTHPATMTHADVDPVQRAAVGISDGLLRLSVGLEQSGEIRTDLARGLDAAALVCGVDSREEPSCATTL